MIAAPVVLGPLAVDAAAAGAPGLLLAGDAAGFIDPMTGDGLRFAVRGGELAARGRARGARRHARASRTSAWRALRRREFAAKWRFNRTLRALVGRGTDRGARRPGRRGRAVDPAPHDRLRRGRAAAR